MSELIVAPSLLSANFSHMAEGLRKLVDSGGDWVHLDVMDGSFVPNITFGHKMVSDLRSFSELPFDVHLMVNHPETFLEIFSNAGADSITIHAEATVHLHSAIWRIKEEFGKKAGLSIVPSTPISVMDELLPLLDVVLVMTVNPGLGGQSFIPGCLDKVRQLADRKREKGYSFLIEVDGGINRNTVGQAIEAGAEVLVVGSAFYSSDDPADLVRYFKELGKKRSDP
jgi:ribulose-phosphate 3-epimerase